ncbi:hypothetical protein HAV_00416 [Candidatus Hepatincola sp. Av]
MTQCPYCNQDNSLISETTAFNSNIQYLFLNSEFIKYMQRFDVNLQQSFLSQKGLIKCVGCAKTYYESPTYLDNNNHVFNRYIFTEEELSHILTLWGYSELLPALPTSAMQKFYARLIQNNYTEEEHKVLDIRLLFESFLTYELQQNEVGLQGGYNPDIDKFIHTLIDGTNKTTLDNLLDKANFTGDNIPEIKSKLTIILNKIKEQSNFYLNLKPSNAKDNPSVLLKYLELLFHLLYFIPYKKNIISLAIENEVKDRINKELKGLHQSTSTELSVVV